MPRKAKPKPLKTEEQRKRFKEACDAIGKTHAEQAEAVSKALGRMITPQWFSELYRHPEKVNEEVLRAVSIAAGRRGYDRTWIESGMTHRELRRWLDEQHRSDEEAGVRIARDRLAEAYAMAALVLMLGDAERHALAVTVGALAREAWQRGDTATRRRLYTAIESIYNAKFGWFPLSELCEDPKRLFNEELGRMKFDDGKMAGVLSSLLDMVERGEGMGLHA